jgi:hypothetical protein
VVEPNVHKGLGWIPSKKKKKKKKKKKETAKMFSKSSDLIVKPYHQNLRSFVLKLFFSFIYFLDVCFEGLHPGCPETFNPLKCWDYSCEPPH